LKVATRQQTQRFNILGTRRLDDVIRKLGCRPLLIPADLLEVIADELFVERRLRLARRILIGWPESR
jgi:hypothetical protein